MGWFAAPVTLCLLCDDVAFQVIIQFVDYGDCEEVNIEDLRSLPHNDLITLPPQVSHVA